ncbi:WhiB family transcriptional regulator [Lentzea sp. NBRC 102530]|uniref:WhiB family transcriptional regulator n=1 Tax=Lentzea sp. NBRC 102530 TaxID=3032201 RepID=UPI0024A5DCF8|nr:WhiB family transcriptional regulator [Lentzea sp. NBRC 102530]GLY53162.1 transcriptional regulator WhiB [Lentzea sp. NBRC 102530]
MTTLVVLRTPKWQVHAARRNADRDVDWIEAEPGSAATAGCKAICRLCPVRLTCAVTALTTDEIYGLWGGMDQVDREALRRADAQIAA